MCTVVDMGCVSVSVACSQTRKVHKVRESFLPSPTGSSTTGWRTASLRLGNSAPQTQRTILDTFAVLELEHITSDNVVNFAIFQLARMNFVIIQLVCLKFVILEIGKMKCVMLELVHEFCEFCNLSARTHES